MVRNVVKKMKGICYETVMKRKATERAISLVLCLSTRTRQLKR